MTIERIAAAIKPILDEDRRADRERIAELERDNAALRASTDEVLEGVKKAIEKGTKRKEDSEALIADLNKQLDELNEKCAALVVERNQLTVENNHLHGDNKRLTDSLAMGNPYGLGLVNKTPTLRIDTDMSDPQPGKLLVVRLSDTDVEDVRDGLTIEATRDQFVGFLVETPAVEVKEQGPWVVYDEAEKRAGYRFAYPDPEDIEFTWGRLVGDAAFSTKELAEDCIKVTGTRTCRVITLAEARAIEAKR